MTRGMAKKARKAIKKALSKRLDNHNCKILAREEELDTLKKRIQGLDKSLRTLEHPYTSLRTRYTSFCLACPPLHPQPSYVHFEEPRLLSRFSLRSNAHYSGNSYGSNEDVQRCVPRHIIITKAVLESSDNPMVNPEQARLQKH
ncbi:hypothetical protein DSO57_1033003 [Entomophthora muscae]|uniref:Uncharacterized protein n=1 Tax=Entomophthora muscae TaxID=34485 RepID=A0ACC2REX0_9FUNG|nr:hypothetical protein DSO57_1033003 [Entomophthora muscae]